MSKNPLRKIAVILLVIFMLPIILYSTYEINSLNQDEEMIEEIYSNQLDAILYSINQYSSDEVNKWASQINMVLNQSHSDSGVSDYLISFLQQNPAVQLLFLSSNDLKNIEFHSLDSVSGQYPEYVRQILQDNDKTVKRLITYQQGGFQKIETLEFIYQGNNLILLLFVLDEPKQNFLICGIVVDPNTFITESLAPRMQQISQDKFVILAYDGSDNLVYATSTVVLDERGDNIQFVGNQTRDGDFELDFKNLQKRDFWLLPDYYLGIVLKGKTISGLVKERATTSILLIVVLDLVLLLGAWFVYRNIRQEIQLAQNKSDFVSNVSHEIRTPLSLISMFAETLEMGRVKTEEKKQEYYTIISKEAQRLAGIVNSILNFSKMEADKRVYDFQPTDLNHVVEDILQTYDFHLKNKGFKYSFQSGSGLEAVSADKEAVSEAVINLLDNAIKYSGDNRQIDLFTGGANGTTFIEVKDYGIGISKEHQKEVFKKFFRASSHLIHNTKGTGLGLSIVKHIMDAHGGKISLESTLNKGSSFKLHFPIDK